MSNRERRGSYDYWGCVADYEQELIEAKRLENHLAGLCPDDCDYCQLDRELAEESKGG